MCIRDRKKGTSRLTSDVCSCCVLYYVVLNYNTQTRPWTLICRGRTRILWRGLDPNQSLMVLREGCERSVWVPKQNMSQTPPPDRQTATSLRRSLPPTPKTAPVRPGLKPKCDEVRRKTRAGISGAMHAGSVSGEVEGLIYLDRTFVRSFEIGT